MTGPRKTELMELGVAILAVVLIWHFAKPYVTKMFESTGAWEEKFE